MVVQNGREKITKETWEKAQKYESAWWRDDGQGSANSFHEEFKQKYYAERMGIIFDQWSRIDLQGKNVLDVGGGPASMLLKTHNAGRRKVIDPLDMPDWVTARYKNAGIEIEKIPAEEMRESGWDEVWMYNVLQHVIDPEEILRRALAAGKVLRVFEFLDRPANEGHPHVLTKELMEKVLGTGGTITQLADPIVGNVYYNVVVKPMEINWVNTGKTFPYAYYIAIQSALKTQKASAFKLWIVEEPEGKYYDLIKADKRVTICKVNIENIPNFPALEGKDEKFQLAHKVDYWRWKLLLENGGIFTDLDSLSVEDYVMYISERLTGKKEFLASLCVEERVAKPYHNSLFAAVKGAAIVQRMLDVCEERLSIDPKTFNWGYSGPDVLNDVCTENLDRVAEAPYGLLGGCIELYQLYKPDGKLPSNIRFIHLWANSINGYWDGINENYILTSNHVYAVLARTVLGIEPIQRLEDFITARGCHYSQLFRYLKSHVCKNILEIGTYTGENALQMIKVSKAKEEDIHYYGVDLFGGISQEKITSEMSHPATPDMMSVKKYLESRTPAKITLFEGDTNIILKQIVNELPSMDLIFIDGGHSVETIKNDWVWVSELIKDSGVIFFDDYLPEMPFIGCMSVVNDINRIGYQVDILPEYDDYPKPWGKLRSQLVAVREKSANINLIPIHLSETPALHVLGLAHTKTNKEYVACAYTQKVLKLCKMMKDIGYTVYHYGAEGSIVDATEDIQVLSSLVQEQTYGNYDWKKEMFKHDPKDLAYRTFNENAIREINSRKNPNDLLLISMGNYQKPIADVVGITAVEMGVGYTGVFTDKRVFESYAWMHYIYGMMYPDNGGCNGGNYDCVIPNYFDPDDFEFAGDEEREDYYLYIGRLIPRKGPHIAYQCCQKIGAKLKIAGQGTPEVLKSLGIDPDKVEFVGYVDSKQRSDLMRKAKAVFVPTIYLEPFGGVNVEAMFCGTPAITSDWGGFTETVQHGKTGYRCRTMDDYVWAALNVEKLDKKYIRDYAIRNYSTTRIAKMYDEYFMKLSDLWRGGWYQEHPERTQLDWLTKYYC